MLFFKKRKKSSIGRISILDYSNHWTDLMFSEGTVYLQSEGKILGRYDYNGRVYCDFEQCIGYVDKDTLIMSIQDELKNVEEMTAPCVFDGKIPIERPLARMEGENKGKIYEINGDGKVMAEYSLNGASKTGAGAAYMLLLFKNKIPYSKHRDFYRDALYNLINHMEGDVDECRRKNHEKKMRDLDRWSEIMLCWDKEDEL